MQAIKLALTGKAGSGKSTIAKRLESYGFVSLSFAHKLKQVCRELYPQLMEGDKSTYRGLMQKFGDATREIDQFVWLKQVANELDNEHKGTPRIVVTDVRYANEYLMLQSRGYKMIKIVRPDKLRAEAGYNVNDNHRSENELDYVSDNGWDLIIHNPFTYPFDSAFDYLLDVFGIDE